MAETDGAGSESSVGPLRGDAEEFARRFPDEEACLAYLWRRRFAADGEHAQCTSCGKVTSFRRYRTAERRRAWTCSVCGSHLHPTAGTVFEGSSTPLRSWFQAARLVASDPGVTVKRLSQELDVGHKTAWRMRKLLQSTTAVNSSGGILSNIEVAGSIARAVPASADKGEGRELPAELTSLVGRERELVEIACLICSSRLVTLVGAGGCGKTRLALRVARDMAPKDAEDVRWVDLSEVACDASVEGAVAVALGLNEKPGIALLAQLIELLRRRPILVVLDNCEHVVGMCASLVEALMRPCPSLRILATSREPMGAAGEVLWRVPSLSVPPDSETDPAVVTRFDAVRLFVDRGVAIDRGFSIDEQGAHAVAALCRLLDGMPLAIELAAGQTDVMAPAMLLQALGDGLGRLWRGRRTSPARHQTLRASLDWSYGMLGESERVVLRRLAVFPGAFSLESALEVCSDEVVLPDQVIALLTALVRKSWVIAEDRQGSRRFRLLTVVHQFADEHLALSGEVDLRRDRHLDWMLKFVIRHTSAVLLAEPSVESLDALDQERTNLRAALDHSLECQGGTKALLLGQHLAMYFANRGINEGQRFLVDALAVASTATAGRRCRALWAAANLALAGGVPERAREHADAALASACEADDREAMAAALEVLGGLDTFSRPTKAREVLMQSLGLARDVGSEWCVAQALHHIAITWELQGDLENAGRCHESAAPIVARLGSPSFMAWHMMQGAILAHRAGEVAAAGQAIEQAWDLFRQLGDPVGLATLAWFGARIECHRGRVAVAEQRVAMLLGTIPRPSRIPNVALALHAAAGTCALARGDIVKARRELSRAQQIAEARAAPGLEAELLPDLCEVILRAEDGQTALEFARQAARQTMVIGNRRLAAAVHMREAQSLRDVDPAYALTLCQHTLADQRAGGYLVDAMETLETIAHLCIDRGDHLRAVRLLGSIWIARRRAGILPRPVDIPARKREWSLLSAQGGHASLRDAFRQGRALPFDEAIDYARRGSGPRGRPSSGWQSLTPMEQRVVQLVATGLNNPQIAERLLVSRATVKAHLSHIFAKLGILNRTRLASELHAQAIRQPTPGRSGQ